MTRTLPPHLLGSFLILPGLALAAWGLSSLKKDKDLHANQNPFAIQKSAYGKLLARLSETTIDRVWHLGVEQIVPHIISGDQHGSSSAKSTDSEHSEHDEPCEHCSHCSSSKKTKVIARKPPIEKAKLWLNEMRYVKYHRTNPYSLNNNHLATVKTELEQMLLNSYKMDPLHYGAYNSYHLFLTTHAYGGTDKTREKARLLAQVTVNEALKEEEDPEAYLTGAAAALNLFFMDSNELRQSGRTMLLEDLRGHRNRIAFLIQRFEELQESSMENGTWENLSIDRQMEITERFRFSKRSFKQFDAMIARLSMPERPSIEKDVAGLLDIDSL